MVVDDHALAVERGRRHRQREHPLDDRRHLVRPILAVPGEHPHAVAITPGDEPVAVMLKLEGPARAVRHGVRRGRQTGWHKAGG